MPPAAIQASEPYLISRAEERRVIVASSVGTVFEWYDFYLYAVLAPFFSKIFFPLNNDTAGTAALLASFAIYAAGFVVRPFGAVILGRLGDLVGRKYTFLISIIFMGFSTFTIGLLPTFEQAGWIAPVLLAVLRLIQGLAVGGEYGGAATYVAEYSPANKRGYTTSWVQTTASLGLVFALAIIALCRWRLDAAEFQMWGWRIPFLVSIVLLLVSIYVRVSLRETPVFRQMKAEGRSSKEPVTESFFRFPNVKYVILALFGATAGQGVVWYTGQFYALFFLITILGLNYLTAYLMVGLSILMGMPFFIFFGWLSDRIGRLRIILAGCVLAALSYFTLFDQLSKAVNPALDQFQHTNEISVRVDRRTCNFHIFVGPWSKFTACDQVTDYLTKAGLSFRKVDAPGLDVVSVTIGNQTVDIQNSNSAETAGALQRALFDAKYPGLTRTYVERANASGQLVYTFQGADQNEIDYPVAIFILFILVFYVTMVYGPIAAFLVELFPAKVRYTSMSFPYHLGNGIFGGILPLLSTAIVANTGNIFAGLWYPTGVALMTFVVGALFLRDQRQRAIHI